MVPSQQYRFYVIIVILIVTVTFVYMSTYGQRSWGNVPVIKGFRPPGHLTTLPVSMLKLREQRLVVRLAEVTKYAAVDKPTPTIRQLNAAINQTTLRIISKLITTLAPPIFTLTPSPISLVADVAAPTPTPRIVKPTVVPTAKPTMGAPPNLNSTLTKSASNNHSTTVIHDIVAGTTRIPTSLPIGNHAPVTTLVTGTTRPTTTPFQLHLNTTGHFVYHHSNGGRLGNKMFEYAALFALAKRLNYTAMASDTFGTFMDPIFGQHLSIETSTHIKPKNCKNMGESKYATYDTRFRV